MHACFDVCPNRVGRRRTPSSEQCARINRRLIRIDFMANRAVCYQSLMFWIIFFLLFARLIELIASLFESFTKPKNIQGDTSYSTNEYGKPSGCHGNTLPNDSQSRTSCQWLFHNIFKWFLIGTKNLNEQWINWRDFEFYFFLFDSFSIGFRLPLFRVN